MKKNLQLTALAFALCCLGLNAQNRTVGSNQPMMSNGGNNHQHNSKTEAPTRNCSTEIPHGEWESWSPEKIKAAENESVEFMNNYMKGSKQMVVYNVPIVFHIVHGGTAVGSGINISQAQILSQFTILNNDFKSAGVNSGLCPSYFLPLKADAEINFCLATRNPTGGVLAEPGIDRRSYTSITGLAAPGSGYATGTIDATIKPNTIWDPTRYCNIWVTQLQGGLLGYATFPIGTTLTGITGNGSATTDGVVCGHNYIGNMGTASSPPFNGGRTLVHELGHWLGLRHINGDGGCTASDFVSDTPAQEALHGGCPSSASPYHTTNCSGNTPNGEMFMNYMDYTDDACMYMWSAGQKARIQQCMVQGTYRSQLSTSASTLCTLSATVPTASISIASSGCVGAPITTTNSSSGTPAPTYVWSTNPAGATFNPNNTATAPTITFPSANVYTVTCVATNSLGNNSNSKVISITACAAVCKDTITNVQSTATLNLATAGSDTATPGCSPRAGYIFGSNCYDDLEKAEYFTQSMYATIATPKITDVIVIFFKDGTRGTGGNNSTPVNLKLYNGTMASGPTGTTSPIATSTANIGAILAAAGTTSVNYCGQPGIVYTNPILRPYKYNFPTNPNAPATNGFFASVTCPTASGDTIVVMSDNTLTTGTNWELWSPNGWYNISPTWGGFDASMAILPIISCSITTGIAESELAANVNLMPNPTTGVFNIVTTLPNVKDIHLTVTNAIGQQITEADLVSVSSGVFTVDLSSYNNGVYFITLQSNGEKVVKRVVVSK
jgi:hypothetical protein